MKIYKTIIIFLLTTITLFAGAQNAEQNFFKYWKYRDRLKYFVVPGYNKGESSIAWMRNRFGPDANGYADINYPMSNIDFGQHGVMFGYYLGMLATEYKVLMNNGQTASAQNTQNEINEALNQLKNYMDACENYWTTTENPNSDVEDGFCIKNDVGCDFLASPSWHSTALNQNLTTDNIWGTNGYPSSFGNHPRGYPGYIDFTVGCVNTTNAISFAMSKDDVFGVLMGLCLVYKCLPQSDVIGSESEIARTEALRMINFIHNAGTDNPLKRWRIFDPNDNAVYGGDARGIFPFPLSQIAIFFNSSITMDLIDIYLMGDVYLPAWQAAQLSPYEVNEYNNAMTVSMAAMSNAWRIGNVNTTNLGIANVSLLYNWEPFYLLLWGVLYDKPIEEIRGLANVYMYSANAMLNSAPCEGPYRYPNIEDSGHDLCPAPDLFGGWASTYRWRGNVDEQKGIGGTYQANFNGLDYMLFYNLHQLYNPSGYINRNNAVETGVLPLKNDVGALVGTNEINGTIYSINTIESTQIIDSDTHPISSGTPGYVVYKAGKEISLKQGFHVKEGTYFDAKIMSFDCEALSGYRLNHITDTVVEPWPPIHPTISGRLTKNEINGQNINLKDTVLLLKSNGELFETVGAAVVDSTGAFKFDGFELTLCDSNSTFKLATYHSYLFPDNTARSIGEWTNAGEQTYDLKCVKLVWEKRHIGADSTYDACTAVDLTNNVYMGGISTVDSVESWDMLVMKYSPTGETKWERTFRGTTSGKRDLVRDLVVDKSGNCYAIGSAYYNAYPSVQLLKYDSVGTLLWDSHFDSLASISPVHIKVDSAGNSYITGNCIKDSYHRIFTFKYNASGIFQWSKYWGEDNYVSYATNLVLDSLGNIFVGGSTQGDSAAFVLLKYSSDGALLWERQYKGLTNPQAIALASDALDNIYITGNILNSSYDILTLKYNAQGELIWSTTFDDATAYDNAKDMVINSGGIWIAGNTGKPSTRTVTIKYDFAGNKLWSSIHHNPAYYNSMASSIVADVAGNVYTSVNTNSQGGEIIQFELVKYDSIGQVVWVYEKPHLDNMLNDCSDMVISPNNNIYISGRNHNYDNQSYALTVKFNQCPADPNSIRIANQNQQHNGTTAANNPKSIDSHLKANKTETVSNKQQTSNNELLASYIKVYPNPNNGNMYVECTLPECADGMFAIYDLTGRKLTEYRLSSTRNYFEIKNSQLPNGIYYYEVIGNNKILAHDKIVVIK